MPNDPANDPARPAPAAPDPLPDPNDAALAPVWGRLCGLRPVRGEGARLYDADGAAWLDATSGIGVANTGHAHPRVVEAIREQAGRLLFAQVNCAASPRLGELAALLREVTPPGIDRFFVSNSGAEAVEAAAKIARHATGRTELIAFQGSFHGRTSLAMALTSSKTAYRHRNGPLPTGVHVAPFPDAYRQGTGEARAVESALAELDLLFATRSAPDETAMVIVEPVLGEGGYLPAPAAFLRGLRERCDRFGIVLAFDEVQSGFGRSGRWFASEASGVVPDVLVMAKGLASGLPLSAVGARGELMDRWEPGTHGGTYGGGSLVPIAAAIATIHALRDEGLPANAAAMGERLRAGLRELAREAGVACDVRGPGLMVGVEFGPPGEPDAALARAVQAGCLERRMLVLTCGPFGNVLRLAPPLVIDEADVDEMLGVLGAALAAARGERAATA